MSRTRYKNWVQRTPYEMQRDQIYEKLNKEQKKIFDFCINTDGNAFIYGSAGTGKSYLLDGIIKVLRGLCKKTVIVCAPTAMAASILGGTTIHKAFGYSIGISATQDKKFLAHAPKIIALTDVIVIDEISQVRMDTFSSIVKSIEKTNKKRAKMKPAKPPVRLIVCGDFAQISPIISTPTEKQHLDELYGFDVQEPAA